MAHLVLKSHHSGLILSLVRDEAISLPRIEGVCHLAKLGKELLDHMVRHVPVQAVDEHLGSVKCT